MYSNYTVEFRFSEPVGKHIKRLVTSQYAQAYNAFCNWVNPQYEKWNEEYREFASANGIEGHDEENYNEFITNKYTPILRVLNSTCVWPIKRYFVGDECDFRCELCNGSTMEMFLKPVK